MLLLLQPRRLLVWALESLWPLLRAFDMIAHRSFPPRLLGIDIEEFKEFALGYVLSRCRSNRDHDKFLRLESPTLNSL